MSTTSTNSLAISHLSNEALYDRYAPVVYGQILRIVPQGPIAEKLLEKVFVHACQNRQMLTSSLRAPLTNLLNHSRIKSERTMLALKMFRECCGGKSVGATDTVPA
jgi:hypothetical protein